MPCDKTMAFDLDEVLFNILDPLLDFHNLRYGTRIRPCDVNNYDLSPVFGVSHEEFARRVHEFYRSEHFNRIRPVPGAQLAIARISQGSDTVAVTDRPKSTKDMTLRHMDRYFSKKFLDVNFTDAFPDRTGRKKAEYCATVGAAYLVEDCLEQALTCAKRGINVLLMPYRWNNAASLPPRVRRVDGGWKEILELYENGKL